MASLDDVRGRLRAHQLAADALLAVLVFIPAVTVPADEPSGLASATPGAALLIVAACLALVWRRRFPGPVWAATLALAVLGITVQGGPSGTVFPTLVALYTLANRTTTRIGVAAAVATAAALVGALSISQSGGWQTPSTYLAAAWSGLAVAVGIAVRNQRAYVAEALERAQRAEETREEEAQRRVAEERLRIARELHDVVAHHISVINVQSGVALHLLDTEPNSARTSLSHIREASEEVLQEMSALLGLLRTSEDRPATQPAPGLGQLDDLVESMRRTGLQVTVQERGRRTHLAPLVDLTAYRVIQESLTNAHKHGAGAAELSLTYGDTTTVIEVANPLAGGVASPGGSGLGLTGMRERVTSLGGLLDAGDSADGRFTVRIELPNGAPLAAAPRSAP